MQPSVVLPDGEQASELAAVVGGLMEENLRDFPSRQRVAARMRGAVVLTASDRDASVTLRFGPGVIEVLDGTEPGAPTISGPWLTLTQTCSGKQSPLQAWRRGELRVQNHLNASLAAVVLFVLSMPASFYGEARNRRSIVPAAVAAAAGLGAVVALVAAARRRSS